MSSLPRPALAVLPPRDRLIRVLYLAAAVIPACFVAVSIGPNLRNIPYWDEFDSVLELLIFLDAGPAWGEVLERLFSLHNEHRMLLSRSLFAASYWVSGQVDFRFLAVIGISFLPATVAVLLAGAPGGPARLRLGAFLALSLFQLQHYESLVWSGSSIDHFLVVLLAAGSLYALSQETRPALLAAGLLAVLATYTLAHGLAVWPVGAWLVLVQRRRRALVFWAALGSAAVAGFLPGFSMNPQHTLPAWQDAGALGHYWLTLIGASPALGSLAVAPWLGGALLIAVGLLLARPIGRGERLAHAMILFCLVALAMVAVGRAGLSAGHSIPSRYMILSSLPWALAFWIFVENLVARDRLRPWTAAATLLLPLGFNLPANWLNAERPRDFANNLESALVLFTRTGSIDRALPALYPRADRGDQLLREALARGVYRAPQLPPPAAVPIVPVNELADVRYYFDAVDAEGDTVFIRGWAFRPEAPPRPRQIAILFRTGRGDSTAVRATHRPRRDVAGSYGRRDLLYSGFELCLPRSLLPAEELLVGLLFTRPGKESYIMTDHRIPARKTQRDERESAADERGSATDWGGSY